MNAVVIDANVFCSLFLKEPKTEDAKKLFFKILEENIQIIIPSLFEYEIYETLLRNGENIYIKGESFLKKVLILLLTIKGTMKKQSNLEIFCFYNAKNVLFFPAILSPLCNSFYPRSRRIYCL
jgi:predicted nucleic acid-binding protein